MTDTGHSPSSPATLPYSASPLTPKLSANFWLRQKLRVSLCVYVCPSGTSLSKTLNLHLSLIVQSQISLRSVSGRLRSVVSGQSQVSLG